MQQPFQNAISFLSSISFKNGLAECEPKSRRVKAMYKLRKFQLEMIFTEDRQHVPHGHRNASNSVTIIHVWILKEESMVLAISVDLNKLFSCVFFCLINDRPIL